MFLSRPTRIASTVLACCASCAGFAAPTVIGACGTIGSPGSYIVDKNLSSTGDCLVIASDFVTIDVDGFVITGGGKGSGIVEKTSDQVTGLRGIVIRNGTVTGFADGVRFTYSTGVTIDRVNSSFNANNGIVLGQRALVSASRADENGGSGIVVGLGSNVRASTAGRNKVAGFNADEGALLVNNEARNNGVDGIFMSCPGAAIANTAGNNVSANLVMLGGSCVSDQNSTL